ncbi:MULTISPECIES: hypothetical protein [Exiguobacterium]|uniref:hypothetical protein n=1 Tax=Exiguobacterium TaxID=33986 RepID=UPI001BEB0AE3|nr:MULTISPECIES: hypothetical protein [Exiguobacterium]MCT4791022.1 hypothetical protein [Exiguobacterium artemiae]
MKKILMVAPLLILFGCGTNEDVQETKELKSKISTLSNENEQLEKKLKESKNQLEEQKLSFTKIENELNKKLKTANKEMTESQVSKEEVEETNNTTEELGHGISTPGDPALPSPKSGTYTPTEVEKKKMYYFDSSEKRYAFAVTNGSVLHVRDQPSKNGKILTSLTDGYEMRTLAYSEDRFWFYINTTTYDGEPISGFVAAEFTE